MVHVESVSRKDRKAREPSGGRARPGLAWEVSHRVSWARKEKERVSLAVGPASSKV